MWDPSALTEDDVDEIVHSAEQPGGTRAISEMYRARSFCSPFSSPAARPP
jgi:hypothetical protein